MKFGRGKALTFDDVILQPRFSHLVSRKAISTVTKLGTPEWSKFWSGGGPDVILATPVIASPMTTVVGTDMAKAMMKIGGMAILHRYCSIDEQVEMFTNSKSKSVDYHSALRLPDYSAIGAAIGVSDDWESRFDALYASGCRVFCIDVAHGHHISVKKVMAEIRKKSGHTCHIMAGNIATAEAFHDLQRWGADSIRVGIGSGSICSTRIQTGHGLPVLQSVLDIMSSFRFWKPKKSALIIDGGIRTAGDMAKALAAGADAVMVGGMLAGTVEAPGSVVEINGQRRKIYVGMAAKATQVAWRGYSSSDEGVEHHVPFVGRVEDVIGAAQNNLRSALSYSGAANLVEFRKKSVFRIQTAAGHIEGTPHVKLR